VAETVGLQTGSAPQCQTYSPLFPQARLAAGGDNCMYGKCWQAQAQAQPQPAPRLAGSSLTHSLEGIYLLALRACQQRHLPTPEDLRQLDGDQAPPQNRVHPAIVCRRQGVREAVKIRGLPLLGRWLTLG
jgi:hypothetical protein